MEDKPIKSLDSPSIPRRPAKSPAEPELVTAPVKTNGVAVSLVDSDKISAKRSYKDFRTDSGGAPDEPAAKRRASGASGAPGELVCISKRPKVVTEDDIVLIDDDGAIVIDD